MTFQNDQQRGRVCEAICERIRGGPWWGFREDVEQPPSIPRPSDKALAVLMKLRDRAEGRGHVGTLTRLSVPGLDLWEVVLLRCAFDFWAGEGDATVSDIERHLDPGNRAMIGKLIVALAQGTRAIEAWIAETRADTRTRLGPG